MNRETKTYFVKNPLHDPSKDTVDGSDLFIAIPHGATHYCPTTIYDQAHADCLNKRQGISRPMAKAAHHCSVLDSWDNFDKMCGIFTDADKPDDCLNVTARIEERRERYFYAHLDQHATMALGRAGMHGCPLGRGHNVEAACADLERRTGYDLSSSAAKYQRIEVTATVNMTGEALQ